jgi:sec-independent protein translocase protein TatB
MSLPDTIFIFVLALIIFGPKRLPEIGRQIGKLLLEFRRASNEFKMQIEEELRAAEQADRQKQFNAQAATPAVAPATVPPASDSPTIRPPSTGAQVSTESPGARVVPVQDEAAELAAIAPEQTAAALAAGDNDNAAEQVTNHHG